jgi:hypothetical protein
VLKLVGQSLHQFLSTSPKFVVLWNSNRFGSQNWLTWHFLPLLREQSGFCGVLTTNNVKHAKTFSDGFHLQPSLFRDVKVLIIDDISYSGTYALELLKLVGKYGISVSDMVVVFGGITHHSRELLSGIGKEGETGVQIYASRELMPFLDDSRHISLADNCYMVFASKTAIPIILEYQVPDSMSSFPSIYIEGLISHVEFDHPPISFGSLLSRPPDRSRIRQAAVEAHNAGFSVHISLNDPDPFWSPADPSST